MPGDVVLFRSDVWHRGTANNSSRIRYLLQVHYGRRMVVQKFPPYLDFRFDPEILAQTTARQRRYLGEHPVLELRLAGESLTLSAIGVAAMYQ